MKSIIIRIATALEYIESRLSEDFDLDSIAFHSTYSRFHFQRLFHACVGFSVFDYIRRRRLSEAARRLLKNDGTRGDDKIIDVALDLGFGSHAGFTRNFREHFGVSPAEFRRQGGGPVYSMLEASDRGQLEHFRRLQGAEAEIEYELRSHPGIQLACAPPVGTDQREILRAWETFAQTRTPPPNSPGRNHDRFAGLIEYAPLQNAAIEFRYSPAIVLEAGGPPVRENYGRLRPRRIPAGDFLICVHRGSVRELPRTFFYIYGPLLAKLKRR
ncbi:MAG: AraC family transcriptional regulator, partial [Leptospirales bacterium]